MVIKNVITGQFWTEESGCGYWVDCECAATKYEYHDEMPGVLPIANYEMEVGEMQGACWYMDDINETEVAVAL